MTQLIQLPDGQWIDPTTITAIRPSGGGTSVIIIDRAPPLFLLVVKFSGGADQLQAEINRLAATVNAAKAEKEPTPQ